jgi:hypothetical protein
MSTQEHFREYLTKEDILQESCVRLLEFKYKDLVWFHVPNEGKRTKFEQFKFKVLGCVAGVSDLIILENNNNSRGLAVELKYGRNKCTKDQVDFMERLSRKGYTSTVVYDHIDEFIKAMDDYMNNVDTGHKGRILLYKNGTREALCYDKAREILIPKNSPHLQGKRIPKVGKLFQDTNKKKPIGKANFVHSG